jgi:hypothetical protein
MDIESYILSNSYTSQEVAKVTSGIKSVSNTGSQLIFTLNDNSTLIVNLAGLSDNNYTTTDKNKLDSIDSSLLNRFAYVNNQLLFDGQSIANNTLDLSNYATKNGNINENFSANNVTIKGNIIPSTNGTQDIGSPTNRFGTLYVNEAKLSTNTLYIGDTAVMGTNQDTIVIKGDKDQSIAMKTTGVGTTKVISENGVELSTSGMNANVTVQATGSGANANLGATNQVNLIAPNINIQGTSTDVKGAIAVDNLTIRGDVTINGGATTIQSTTVQVEDNIIELNKGEVGYGVTAGRSGLKIDRGDADDYLIIFTENDDSLKIGTDSLLQKVATENYVDSKDSLKADKVHSHDMSDITNLQSTLDNKANISAIPTKTSQLANDSGYLKSSDITNISSGHTIKDSTISYPQRKNLKFTGDGVTVTDDNISDTTIVNISNNGGFLNVKSLGMTIADGGTQAIISFTNPNTDGIVKIYLYASYLEDLSNQSYSYVSTHATLLSDSLSITKNATNTFNLPITDANRNKSVYIRVFVNYGGTDYSSGSSINQVLADVTPTSPVTNITVTQLAKDSVKLTWSNPNESDLKSVNVVMKYDTTLNSIYDGTLVYTGNGNTCTVTGLSVGKHVYFRIYTLDISNNIQSDQSQIIDIQLDNTPPNEVTNFSVLSGFSLCKLKFSDSISTDWKISKVIRKVGSEPTSIDDGTLILTNMTRDVYKNNYFIDGGLSNGTSYYYKVYSIDNFGNISSGISQIGSPVTTSLPEVNNFKIVNIQNGTKQKISWTNAFAPSGLTYVERQLFYTKDQTVSLDTMTRDQCIASGLITSLSLSAGTGQGIDDSFTTSSALTIGDISRYKIFVHFDSSGTAVWSSGTYDIKEVKDETPLTDVTGLITTAGDTQTTIQWTNPNTSLDSDFAKVQIYRKIGAYPDGMNDLEKVYESTNKNAGNLNTFFDTGLTNNILYYYLIKLTDTSGNININTKFTLTPVPLPIYSISYNSLTKTWTRGNLASTMSATDFNNISPYKDIKRVLLTDAKAKTYLKSTDSTLKEDGTSATLDGTQGNVFSEIPKFYYKYNYDGASTHTWTIANSAIGGCALHPAFIRNSVNKDYLYIGSYKGYVNGTKLESRSGILPTTSGKSYADFRTLGEARGTGFTQFDSLGLHVLQLLFIMQYGHSDFSSVLNSGQDIGNVLTTGGTNSLGNSTGVVGNYSSLYGVENLIGETYNIVDGLIAGSKYYQSNNSFASMTSESTLGTYSQLSSAIPSIANGFISDIEPISSVFIGKNMDASSTTGFCDYQLSKNGSNLNVLLMGGSALADQRGLFNNEFVDVSVMSSTNNMIQGSLIESTYTEWTLSVDKTAYGIKSISSFSLVDGVTPSITTNLSISNLAGRLIAY